MRIGMICDISLSQESYISTFSKSRSITETKKAAINYRCLSKYNLKNDISNKFI